MVVESSLEHQTAKFGSAWKALAHLTAAATWTMHRPPAMRTMKSAPCAVLHNAVCIACRHGNAHSAKMTPDMRVTRAS